MATKRNPFQYGKIAEKENFIDRNDDRAFLKQNLASGINVILISPRRWGKSSLVKRAMAELQKSDSDVRVCFIDAFPITSTEEFYQILARAILKATATHAQQVLDLARKFLRSVIPSISFGPDPANSFSISLDFKGNQQNETDILKLPERIAKEQNRRVVVCIDEFQKLAGLPGYEQLENQMRSVWQHQQNTSYCLYGSQRHMMSEIFDSTEKPFYRFGQVYYLKKIARDDWAKYIMDRFASTNKKISEARAERIADSAECHSWYVQQLASAVWNATDKTAGEDSLRTGFEWCVEVNSEAYRGVCDGMTGTQIGMLRAVAKGEGMLTAMETLRNYKLGTSANAVRNKKMLMEMDIIASDGGGYAFLDPIFKAWFIEKYQIC